MTTGALIGRIRLGVQLGLSSWLTLANILTKAQPHQPFVRYSLSRRLVRDSRERLCSAPLDTRTF